MEMEGVTVHPDAEVQQALVALCDRLCTWERATGRESVLILREQGGFIFRAQSGKPGIPGDVPDEMLYAIVGYPGDELDD